MEFHLFVWYLKSHAFVENFPLFSRSWEGDVDMDGDGDGDGDGEGDGDADADDIDVADDSDEEEDDEEEDEDEEEGSCFFFRRFKEGWSVMSTSSLS